MTELQPIADMLDSNLGIANNAWENASTVAAKESITDPHSESVISATSETVSAEGQQNTVDENLVKQAEYYVWQLREDSIDTLTTGTAALVIGFAPAALMTSSTGILPVLSKVNALINGFDKGSMQGYSLPLHNGSFNLQDMLKTYQDNPTAENETILRETVNKLSEAYGHQT
jgi:hypothetical protein